MNRVFGRWVVASLAMIAALCLVGQARADDRSDRARPATGHAVVSVPVEVSGTVVMHGDGRLGVLERGADSAVAFMVNETTTVVRDGQSATVADLRPGDAVRMTVDGRTGQVVTMRSVPAGAGALLGRQAIAWFAPTALVAVASVLFARRRAASWLGENRAGQTPVGRAARSPRWPARSMVAGGAD